MIEINIPGRKKLKISNIVFDYNGTVALDGFMPEQVKKMIIRLSQDLNIYIITADTYGNVREQCKDMPVSIETFAEGNATIYKKQFIEKIGAECTIAVGNGLNDIEMLKTASLSISVIGEEGCASLAIVNSDITCRDIMDVFSMVLKKDRIRATLRD